MNITVEKLPNCMASLTMQVPAEKRAAARNAILANYAKHAAIPGFRKGKVPRSVVEKRFKEEIDKEAEERVVSETLREAIQQEKLNVLNVADLKTKENSEGELGVTARLFLAPEFELPEYKGLAVTVPKMDVTDEQVEKVLEEQRERMATLKPSGEGHPAAMGDFITIDYVGSLEGTPLADLLPEAEHFIATNTGFLLKLTEDNFVPGFCKQLEGIKTGETREIKVTMPEESVNEVIAGKEVQFVVTAGAIQEAVLPPLDDDFASLLLENGTLESLRAVVRQSLEANALQKDLENKRVAAMEALRQKVDFDLPENVVNNAAQRRVNELVKMNLERGLTEDMLAENESAILEAASSQAKVDVKDEFLLMEIVKKENIQVTQRDMISRISTIAQQARVTPQKVIKSLQKNDGLGNVQHSVLLVKALDVLVQHANIEYKAAEAPADAES